MKTVVAKIVGRYSRYVAAKLANGDVVYMAVDGLREDNGVYVLGSGAFLKRVDPRHYRQQPTKVRIPKEMLDKLP